MDSADTTNNEMGIEEKNTIVQAWSDFKYAIFNVLFVMLDKNSDDD